MIPAYFEMRAALAGDSDRPVVPMAVREVRCPYCRAVGGNPCVVRAEDRPLRLMGAHPARYVAAGAPVPPGRVPAEAWSGVRAAVGGQSTPEGPEATESRFADERIAS